MLFLQFFQESVWVIKIFKKCIFESASFIKVNVVLISFGAIGSKLNFDGN